MKTTLITITTSIITSALTLAIALLALSSRPIQFPAKNLPDGNIEKHSFNLLSGKASSDVFDKEGKRLYTLVTFRNDPIGTSILYTYDKNGLSRKDVFTTPVSGVSECKVYKPNSLDPICSYLWTSISQTGEQKRYFDASLTEISFNEFQSIRGIK